MDRANKKIIRVTHKHGFEPPTSVVYSKRLDQKNDNALQTDAMNRDIENLKVAFDILEDGTKITVGYNKAYGHLVFDDRMTLEHKSLQVKDVHRTPELEWSTFPSVVSRESARIMLTNAALNDLLIYAYDIQNYYLQAISYEKYYFVFGNTGKHTITIQSLHGRKSSGSDYWRHVRSAMEEMGISFGKADPDARLRPT